MEQEKERGLRSERGDLLGCPIYLLSPSVFFNLALRLSFFHIILADGTKPRFGDQTSCSSARKAADKVYICFFFAIFSCLLCLVIIAASEFFRRSPRFTSIQKGKHLFISYSYQIYQPFSSILFLFFSHHRCYILYLFFFPM
ncbi:hypothetical protein F4804DRAFT_82393 [Jackrogersella minutella]|nr:hypothetical protein F4804DRAFT_82393 [Jackrogersella minutella]